MSNPWITAVFAAVLLAPLLTLGIGSRAGYPAGWRDRARLMARNLHPRSIAGDLLVLAWIAVVLLPPGRRHERHVREQLGMGRDHPERCTRPGWQHEQQLLERLQAETWPDGDWADAIRYRDGGAS